MSVTKKYLDGVVSGGAVRDKDGNRIDTKYQKKLTTIEESKNNILIVGEDGGYADSGVPITKVLIVHGQIKFSGQDTNGVLGADYAGLTESQLMTMYPFNELRIHKEVAYTSDGTELDGEDSFLEMPNFYKKVTCTSDGGWVIDISNAQLDSYYKRCVDADWVSKLHIAVYKGGTVGSYVRSQTGLYPTNNVSQATLIGMMPYYMIGSGVKRRAEYEDYRIRGAYEILCWFYLKCRNTQLKHYGMANYTTAASSDNIPNRCGEIAKSGATDLEVGVGVDTGSITSFNGSATYTGGTVSGVTLSATSGYAPFKLLGVENPYGLAWENLYGAVHKSGLVYAYEGTDELTSAQISPSDTNTVYEATDVQMATSNGYQSAHGEHNGMLFPTAVAGSESTNVGDYYWYASGWRIFLVGGNLADAAYVGLSCLYAYIAFGNAGWGIGVRLSYLS